MYKSKKEIIMKKEERLQEFLEQNNGYISTTELLELNIYKSQIHSYIDKGIIEKVCHGLYMNTNNFKDEYYIIQKKYPSAIFSYNTALHILNLTNKTPSIIDITVPRNKKVRGHYKIHYISKKYYEIGIINTTTPLGNPVKVYNAERCICDMLRSEVEFDLELKNRILNYYFVSKEKNIELLLEYAKAFKIYEKVNTIMEVMMKW